MYTLEPIALEICVREGFVFGGGIGSGSFKETFLVTNPDGTTVALKVLKPGCSPERTDREIDAMQRCSHPNIATLLKLAEIDSSGTRYSYLVEAFLGGGTLGDRLGAGTLDRDPLLAIGEDLIRAVAYIAAQNLVHRDLKPANVMFPVSGFPAVVVDFGIVRDLDRSSITETYLGMGPGTPYFAAPEQLNNDKQLIDWRTDQFAAGVTLSLARFGFHPYEEVGDDSSKTINRVAARRGPTERFRTIVTELPVLERMVAPWPVLRVRTPEELLSEWNAQKGAA